MRSKLPKPYLRKYGESGGSAVWIVDGSYIRRWLDPDFTNFGHHLRDACVPAGEYWIDVEQSPGEAEFFIRNMRVDERLLRRRVPRRLARLFAERAELNMRLKSPRFRRLKRVMTEEQRLARVRQKLIARHGRRLKLWLVDGMLVRTWYRIPFTQGGHDHVYKFVPRGEVWIDDDLTPAERPLVILHELHERALMARGVGYDPRGDSGPDSAHGSALVVERACRRKPALLAGHLLEAVGQNGGGDRSAVDERLRSALFVLNIMADPRNVAGMARYGIKPRRPLGVSHAFLDRLARAIGRDHRLALRLWRSGIHEAKMLAALVDDPSRVTERQMERWAAGFDSWDICDSVCGHLFDRTRYAWKKAGEWPRDEREYVRRAGFALMVWLAVHDKEVPDARFRRFLPLIRRGAADDRNFVKKAVNWALRAIGKRGPGLRRQCVALAKELAGSGDPSARWVGADALRELQA